MGSGSGRKKRRDGGIKKKKGGKAGLRRKKVGKQDLRTLIVDPRRTVSRGKIQSTNDMFFERRHRKITQSMYLLRISDEELNITSLEH